MALEELVLLLPGPVGGSPCNKDETAQDEQWPTLRRWLARADREDGMPGMDVSLARHLQTPLSRHEIASAALRRLGDFGNVSQGHWLAVDPVHLAADLSNAVLVPGAELGIDVSETEAVTATLNAHLREEGLEIEWRDPTRWYVRLPQAPTIETTPLPEVAGRPVRAFLPKGSDAKRWQRTLTELQMLLHTHEVNAAREAMGRPTINGLWLWGEGDLPAPPPQGWRLLGDGPVLAGLTRLQERDPVHLSDLESVVAGAPETTPNALAWVEDDAILDREPSWFARVDAALRAGRIGRLAVDPANGYVYRLTRRARMRFWRRPQGLDRYLARE